MGDDSAMLLPYRQRQLTLCRAILDHKVFRLTLEKAFSDGAMPDKDTIVGFMKDSGLQSIDSESTYHRRAGTIERWAEWVISLYDD